MAESSTIRDPDVFKLGVAMDVKEAFSQVIVEVRKEKGVSQERLALEANLDRSYMSKLENAVYQPSLSKILDLADVLGVRAGEIVDRVDALVKAK